MTRRPVLAALSLAALIALAGPTWAQTTRPARRGDGNGGAGAPAMQRLTERLAALDLTPEQTQQVDQIKAEMSETIRGMAAELKDLSPQERRAKMQDALGDVREKIKSVLTPEQQAKFKESAAGGAGPGGRRALQAGAGAKGVDGSSAAKPATAPTTRPALKPARPGIEGQLIGRLQDAVDALGLTPEQKTKTDAIFDDAAAEAKKIREAAGGDRESARQKAIALTQSLRTKLAEVLTPEQKEKLADKMAALRGGPTGAGAGRRGLNGNNNRAPATRPSGDAAPAVPPADGAPAAAVANLTAGDSAPAFTLRRLSGATVTNKNFAGKPLVLAFGSYSSPAFRDRLPRLEAIKNQYRGRAAVLVVYTKEEHPADGWQVERNKDDKIEINQPTTLKERVAVAVQMRDATKTGIDILVDDTTDAVATAYGSRPQGAAVISRYGKIIGTQTFCDPSGLPRMIDEALAAKE